ncbi:acyl-CoA synthetase [Streptomyces antnestii]|uniref:Acyl-CoA synthetase n=1 Tax=Streptomyces antnestii TaxID=2494256 RepID=A0A437Q3D0_9ACTN|nr:AMP-binding protein [Streptomyces sp. San01]RVU29024.1 acyl-CoA synthetase [Streptomyces sp. San01]
MHVPATPLDFLKRSETLFADRTAVVDGDRRFTYGEFADRCRRAGGALEALGIRPGDRVALLCRNSTLMLEAHYAVPSLGAVLVPLNFRLLPEELQRLIDHSGAGLILYDDEFESAAAQLGCRRLSASEYEEAIDGADPVLCEVADEHDLLSINYTSGTTGRPKGVMYDHRGAYLQALAMVTHGRLDLRTNYLWTLPMFHCNGWTFVWAVTAAGGTHVCLDAIDPKRIWEMIGRLSITHLNAAPTVLISLANEESARAVGGQPLRVGTGGAPPSPSLLSRLADFNIDVTHLYGLTETYGPAAVCAWQPEWSELPMAEQAQLKARQGNANILGGLHRVVDPQGRDVPADGETVGEVILRGNNVMRGYFRDPEATNEALRGGWFHSGDLAVMHPDGYFELRDRAKDIIIAGGENIASIEVEQALAAHEDVIEVAVVGASHHHWGEVPVAYVVRRAGAVLDQDTLIRFARKSLAGFKVPKEIRFVEDLPKTATGKVQKYLLRTSGPVAKSAGAQR